MALNFGKKRTSSYRQKNSPFKIWPAIATALVSGAIMQVGSSVLGHGSKKAKEKLQALKTGTEAAIMKPWKS